MFPALFHGSCLYLTAREKQRGPSRAKPKKDCIDYEQYCEATCYGERGRNRSNEDEKIIKANPFLEGFTVADLRNWAERKMRVPRRPL
jgi:hypothetical protein